MDATTVDPQSFGMFSLETQAAGGLLSLVGALTGAQSQQDLLRAQAEIAKINATSAENNARTALMIGQREEQRSMLQTAQLKGRQTASMAANGIDLGEGSAARVLTDTDIMGKIDQNTIKANAMRQAWGLRTQAVSFRNDAAMREAQAGAIAPWLVATSSLLNSAGSVASNWYAMSKAGMFSGDTSGAGVVSGGNGIRF